MNQYISRASDMWPSGRSSVLHVPPVDNINICKITRILINFYIFRIYVVSASCDRLNATNTTPFPHFYFYLLARSRILLGTCSALVPVSRYYGWHGARNVSVVPLEGQTSQILDGKEGVYDYAQEGGEVAEVFGEFCRNSLCMESWDFIMDSVAYKVPSGL